MNLHLLFITFQVILNFLNTICCLFALFTCQQAPEGDSQPSADVDLFISTEKIMVLNTDLKVRPFKIM